MPQLERDIQASAVTRARRRGWIAIKQGAMGSGQGWPDYLFIQRNTYVWIEFKRPHGVLSPLQTRRVGELIATGATVYVCYASDEALWRLAENSWWLNSELDDL